MFKENKVDFYMSRVLTYFIICHGLLYVMVYYMIALVKTSDRK